MDPKLESIYNGVIDGAVPAVEKGVRAALDAGVAPQIILNEAMIAAMREVGSRFECGEYYVPEMLIAARAMKAGLVILKPVLAAAAIEPVGKIALGTVKGDLHDIGKNLVGMMLEGAGFEVVDLGVDVPPEKFANAVKDGVQMIGMSALLTTTMPMMKMTMDQLVKLGVRDQVKVLVGGAPVTEAFAQSIGADAFASDASTAARKALELIKK
jgi:5-methyltetrahydrofolate--homocysteine methyltransferase